MIRHFPQNERNYIIYIEEVDNLNLFTGENFRRAHFHRVTFHGSFNWATETRCQRKETKRFSIVKQYGRHEESSIFGFVSACR